MRSILFLCFILLLAACGKEDSSSDRKWRSMPADADHDGISNLEELKRGTDPFIDKLKFESLNKKVILKLGFYSDTGVEVEEMSFMNRSSTVNYLISRLRSMEKVNTELLMHNLLACIPKKSFQLLIKKHGINSINRAQIRVDNSTAKDFPKNTQFFWGNLKGVSPIVLLERKRAEFSTVMLDLSLEDLKEDLCLAYSKESKVKRIQKENLKQYILLKDNSYDSFYVYPKAYNLEFLKKRIAQEDEIKVVSAHKGKVFLPKYIDSLSRSSERFTLKGNSLSFFANEGDRIFLEDRIQSHIDNSTVRVGWAKATKRRSGRRGEGPDFFHYKKGVCGTYQKPRSKSSFTYRNSLENFENYKLLLSGKEVYPRMMAFGLLSYEFIVTQEMINEKGEVKLNFPLRSKDKFSFPSYYYNTLAKKMHNTRCDRTFRQNSTFQNNLIFKHKFKLVRSF